MKTTLEEEFEKLWLPNSDESRILEDTSDSVKNPIPSKVKVWDYYTNSNWWQRRYIISIDWDKVAYSYYSLENYKLWNSGRYVNGKIEYYKPNSWFWEFRWYSYCSKAHIRSWSQK